MAPASLRDLLTAFNSSGDAVAITAGDGRIKTWNAATGEMQAEFVDLSATSVSGADTAANGHLSVDYTCIAWGPSLSASTKKGKKKGGKDRGATLLVLGTGGGDVLGWDTTLGQLTWRINDCHSGGVKSVAISKSGRRYIVGAAMAWCVNWIMLLARCYLSSGAKTALSSVNVSPDGGTLVAASAELKLYDLSSKKRLRKFAGHPASVHSVLFTHDGKYVLSCAIGERHVAMWQCEGSKVETGIACSLSLEQPAVALDCCGFGQGGEVLRVLAVSEAGVAYVWSGPSVAELATVQPLRISVNSTVKAGKGSKPCILAARLVEGGGAVLVAHGTSARPQFERVKLDGNGELNIILGASANGALLPPTSTPGNAIQAAPQEVTVLGLDSAGDAVIPGPRMEIGTPSKKISKKRRASTEIEDETMQLAVKAEKSKQVEEADADVDMAVDGEQTMEERLIALNLVADTRDDKIIVSEKETVVPPRADSLQVLLLQALQADDSSLLEQCLSVVDDKIITNTVRRLRPLEATKFLNLSVSRLEARPQRALGLVPWVRAVLLQHAAFIMSNPAMQPVLTSLYQIIDARLTVFRQLLSLSGRLDLIMAQISANEMHFRDTEEAEPAVVYEEEDSEPEAHDVTVDDDSELSDTDEGRLESEEEEVHGNGNGTGGEDSGDRDNDMDDAS